MSRLTAKTLSQFQDLIQKIAGRFVARFPKSVNKDDIVQMVNLDLLRYFKAGKSIPGSPGKFIATLVHHSLVDIFRRKAGERRALEGYARTVLASKFKGLPDERLRAMRRQINALPQSLRGPLELHYLMGMKAEQIARVLGISKQAVFLRLNRGRDRLRIKIIRRKK